MRNNHQYFKPKASHLSGHQTWIQDGSNAEHHQQVDACWSELNLMRLPLLFQSTYTNIWKLSTLKHPYDVNYSDSHWLSLQRVCFDFITWIVPTTWRFNVSAIKTASSNGKGSVDGSCTAIRKPKQMLGWLLLANKAVQVASHDGRIYARDRQLYLDNIDIISLRVAIAPVVLKRKR